MLLICDSLKILSAAEIEKFVKKLAILAKFLTIIDIAEITTDTG